MTSPDDRKAQDQIIWSRFRHHSKTFSASTLLLPRHLRMPVASLYMFCRRVDDVADRRILAVGRDEARRELDELNEQVLETLSGRPPGGLLWSRLSEVHTQFGLDVRPMQELIDGARWDLDGRSITNTDELVAYSDLVGGSIGAMMLPLLTSDPDPLMIQEARSIGIAMQITNILRDVGEDRTELSRSYLPADRARELGVHLHSPSPSASGYRLLMEELMTLAEKYFEKGIPGIARLPLRMRSGILAATRMYREILNEVRRNRYDNVNRRAYVSLPRKLLLSFSDGYEGRRQRLRKQLQGSA